MAGSQVHLFVTRIFISCCFDKLYIHMYINELETLMLNVFLWQCVARAESHVFLWQCHNYMCFYGSVTCACPSLKRVRVASRDV